MKLFVLGALALCALVNAQKGPNAAAAMAPAGSGSAGTSPPASSGKKAKAGKAKGGKTAKGKVAAPSQPPQSAGQCDVKNCPGAATCSNSGGTVSYKDSQGNPISTSMCRNPAAFVKCASSDANCCKNGYKQNQCQVPPDVLNQTCSTLDCGGQQGLKCTVDPCDACSLQVTNAQGQTITSQCKLTPPKDLCTKVQCPNMGSANCTQLPDACAGTNLQCIKDACACKWRWFSVDIAPPSAACNAAIQVCYDPSSCPNSYQCDPIPASAKLTPEVQKQYVCTQELCSCRPVWTPPVYGIRQKCAAGDQACCSDGLQKANCPQQQSQWACQHVACNSTSRPGNCQPDGCNQCQINIFDGNNQKIPQGQCRLNLQMQAQQLCSKVQCPSGQKPSCGPRPSCYPNDWALDCIVDPCSCRSMWVDSDVRSNIPPSCSKQIQPSCLTADQCPKTYDCNDVPADQMAKFTADQKADLVCVQQPCTCQPVTVQKSMLPAGFRLPCKSGIKCCSDNQGPLVCPAQLAAQACHSVQCPGKTVGNCSADGCNNCAISVTDKSGATINPSQCRLPVNETSICPGTVCPAAAGAPSCGPRPSACPSDWNLRCIRDPCVCTRSIWVDEDLRIPDPKCSAAIQPTCATTCPTQFSCPGLPSPLKCIQERCTCRPIVDPTSIPPQMQQQPGQQGQQNQTGQQQQGQMGQQQQGQMGQQQGQMGQQQQGQTGQQGSQGQPNQQFGQRPPAGQQQPSGPSFAGSNGR